MSIAPKCTCGKQIYYCGKDCPKGILPATPTQLPDEVVADINEKASLSLDFLSNDETVSDDELKSYKKGWIEGATAYAEKLHQAQQEIEELKRWKQEAAELLAQIHAYAHKHMDVKLGQCNVKAVIDRCKERDSAIDLLQEAATQIEYLHKKFTETGSGNNVLSRIKTFLDGE